MLTAYSCLAHYWIINELLVVEIEEKITYKVEFSADSQEYAERRVREIYDSGALKSTGELESVIFDVIDVIDVIDD